MTNELKHNFSNDIISLLEAQTEPMTKAVLYNNVTQNNTHYYAAVKVSLEKLIQEGRVVSRLAPTKKAGRPPTFYEINRTQ